MITLMNNDLDFDCLFTSPQLGEVLTMQEVCVLWGKSPRQVYYAIDKDRLLARKSITGGSWLIQTSSIICFWGEPEQSIKEWMV